MMDSGSNGKKGRGFAGLDSMVSDVSEDVERAAETAPPKAPLPVPPPSEPSAQPARTEPRPAPAQSPPPAGPGKSGLGWGIAGIVVLVIWIANSGSGNKSQPAPSYSPPLSYSTPGPIAPPAPAVAPAPAPISDEQKPPIGRNNVLNIPQIRWCKREMIRIKAIENVINNAYEFEVDRFNAKVSDYNSRCGEFRYRPGNVEEVDRELASERESIASKAKSEWVRKSLGIRDGTEAAPKKAKPPAANKQETAPKQDSDTSTVSLSYEERESIESACSGKKILDGPAAYNKCLSGKLAALKAGPRNIDLSGLNYTEKESIESACSGKRILDGPAAYNKCLTQKLRQL